MLLLRLMMVSFLVTVNNFAAAYFDDQSNTVPLSGYKMVSPQPVSVQAPPTGGIITASPRQLMHAHNAGCKTVTGTEAVEQANRKALVQPISSRTFNSIIVFPYQAGDLYQIYATPLNVTDLEFQPGEQIISIAAGDTMRWEISRTASGTGADLVEHVLVKPQSDDLTTTLVVTTTIRTYHLILTATKNTFMATVQWKYDNGVTTLNSAGGFTGNAGSLSQAAIPNVSLANLDFAYELKWVRGPRPDWYPKVVFNDGSKTYIEFPGNIQSAPALFIKQSGSGDAAVNYRVVDNYYVVDQVITEAELMSGNGAMVVTISSTKK